MRSNCSHNYLNRHAKYIDYRLSIIKNYVSLRNDVSIEKVVEYLISDVEEEGYSASVFTAEVIAAIKELRMMIHAWDILENGDIVGYIYQYLQSSSKKKKRGQFFTPPDLVRYLISRSLDMNFDPGMKILDPACGSGQFLISIYASLMKILDDRFPSRDKRSAHIILNMIHGNDIDPVAAKIARYNLHRISGINRERINITENNYLIRREMDLFNTWGECDLIIGNPPWGGTLTPGEKNYTREAYRSSKSGINTFTLFMERSFDFLTKNGTLAFLIPEAYLNIKTHMSSRRLILNNAVVRDIARWGDRFKGVYSPAVSLICSREQNDIKREKNIIHINHESKPDSSVAFLIPQASYRRSIENIFLLEHNRKAANILSGIENRDAVFLKGRARFYLGIVTGNNSLHISDRRSSVHPDPILLGNDVSQYRFRFSNHYFEYDPEKLQQVAPRHLYLARDKILYKFIGKRLTFALDTEGYYSLNNINGFVPETETMNIESILAILNSRVIQYFYEKKFFTVKVLRGNLEKLPIVKIQKETQKKLARLTRELMASGEHDSNTRENIEDIIFREYGIRDRDAYFLSESTDMRRVI